MKNEEQSQNTVVAIIKHFMKDNETVSNLQPTQKCEKSYVIFSDFNEIMKKCCSMKYDSS